MEQAPDADAEEEWAEQDLAKAITEMLDFLRRDKCEDLTLPVSDEDATE